MKNEGVCFMCGNQFNNHDRKKTNHHSIPVSLNPVSNLKIPVCEKCHYKINNSNCYGNQNIKVTKYIHTMENALKNLREKLK